MVRWCCNNRQGKGAVCTEQCSNLQPQLLCGYCSFKAMFPDCWLCFPPSSHCATQTQLVLLLSLCFKLDLTLEDCVQDHIQDPHKRLAWYSQRHADCHEGHCHAEHYLRRVWALVRHHCHQREWLLDCSRAGAGHLLRLREHPAERQALLWGRRPGV